jgi:hypothetical protein
VKQDSIKFLQQLENKIQAAMRQYTLDQLLIALWHLSKTHELLKNSPFLRAGFAMYAVRFSEAGNGDTSPMIVKEFSQLVDLAGAVLFEDPIGFDEDAQRRLLEEKDPTVLFPLLAKQAEMQRFFPEQFFARAYWLYARIPPTVSPPHSPLPDFEVSFTSVYGVSPLVFLKICLVAFCRAKGHPDLTLDYFRTAADRMELPRAEYLGVLRDHISAEPSELRLAYSKNAQGNPLYSMCYLNPLLRRPLIQPWTRSVSPKELGERLTCPVPELISYRASNGVYYDLMDQYGKPFLDWFGSAFEAYVGQLLQASVSENCLLTESQLHNGLPKGIKKPDFVIITGETAVVIECKCFRYTREAYEGGDREAVYKAIKKTVGAFKQTYDIQQLDPSELPEPLASVKQWFSVVVTFGQMHPMQAPVFREIVDRQFQESGVKPQDWRILSIDELESLQPHLSAGVAFHEVLTELRNKLFSKVIEALAVRTGRSFKDSFLWSAFEELCNLQTSSSTQCNRREAINGKNR